METRSDEISSSALQQILKTLSEQTDDINKAADVRLMSFRQEIVGGTSSVSQDIKKLKTEQNTTWKSEGNRDQFEQNSKVSDTVTQALWALENGKFDYCKALLTETVELCTQRNKLVKIADQSQCSWNTVKSKIEKVPRGIRGEKSSKDMASSRNLVSTIGALASPKMGDGTRCPEG